ncbi:MAG TPA: efflux RND transporter periplasmic adaptor subunit [Polyangiaceae bacterium]
MFACCPLLGSPRRLAWLSLLSLVACQAAPAGSVVSPPPPAVHVAKATKSDGTRSLKVSGTLEAETSTTLSFAVIGTVEAVFVKEGQAVRRGQAVARITPGTYRDALDIARSKANQAEDAQRRLKPMYDNKTLPEVKMVEVDTGLEQARLSVSMAAKNLSDTTLRAPTDGIVAKRYAEPGTSASPGVPIVSLVQTRTILASAPVPETRVAKLKVGDKGHVFVSALGCAIDGTVRDIAMVADPLTRTYVTRLTLPNHDGTLRVGMVAEIDLPQAGEPEAVVVPPESIRLNDQGTPYLFVVKDGDLLEQRLVKVPGYVGEGVAIAAGLAEGERVVTSGTTMLEAGMKVRIVARNDLASPRAVDGQLEAR